MPPRMWFVVVPLLVGWSATPAAAGDRSDCRKPGGGDETIAACSRMIASNALKGAELASAFSNRGVAYKRKGDLDRAIADYDEAIKINPKNGIAFINRGLGYLKKGDLDRTIADLSDIIRLYPKFAMGYGNRGEAYLRKGELDRALADLNEAIATDPQLTTAYAYRGLVQEKKGDRERARADFEMALSLPATPYSTAGQSAHETARARLAALAAPQIQTTTIASAAPAGEPGRRGALLLGISKDTDGAA